MKKRYYILICSLPFVILLFMSCRYIEVGWHYHFLKSSMRNPRQFGQAQLTITENMPILHLYGTPKEMGTQYGTLLKNPLQRLFKCVNLFIDKNYRKELIKQAAVIEKNLPDPIRQELQAIAKAADLPYMDLVTMNVTPRMMCSTVAIWGKASESGKMLMGRNSDFPSFHLEKILGIIVVYHSEKEIPVVSINFLGMIGSFTGINANGVSFGNMLVFNAEDSDDKINPKGLPIQLLMRSVAHQTKTADDFIHQLENSIHLIPMNVMAVDKNNAFLAELTNRKTIIRKGTDDYLASSNYFISPKLTSYTSSCKRYKSIIKDINKYFSKIDSKIMEKILYNARIEDINVQAVVFEPESLKAHISINKEPAAEGPYHEIDIKQLIQKSINR